MAWTVKASPVLGLWASKSMALALPKVTEV